MKIDQKLDLILNKLEGHDKKFDAIEDRLNKIENRLNEHDKRFNDIESKLDEHNKRFNTIEAKLDEHNKRFNTIEAKLDEHNKRFNTIEAKLDEYNKRFDSIELKITIFEANNREEHEKIFKHLDSLNSSFIKFESEGSDKFKILFDAHKDFLEYKDIFTHELSSLDKFVKQNSYRISKLEKNCS